MREDLMSERAQDYRQLIMDALADYRGSIRQLRRLEGDMAQTADDILKIARENRPNVAYTTNADCNRIAAWHGGRWICVACRGIDGQWYSVETELLIDDKPVWGQTDWLPVEMTEEQANFGMEVSSAS